MDKEELQRLLDGPTMTVPEAGRVLRLSRSSSYVAAKSGDIRTVKVGGKLLVPTRWLRQLLMMDAEN